MNNIKTLCLLSLMLEKMDIVSFILSTLSSIIMHLASLDHARPCDKDNTLSQLLFISLASNFSLVC